MSKFNEAIAKDVKSVIKVELVEFKSELTEILQQELKETKELLERLPQLDKSNNASKELDKEFVYLPEAAEILRCSVDTVKRHEKRGFFTRLNRVPNSPIYYLKKDIFSFITTNDN
ncbi:hypothetical protein N7E81_07270 [Reichenbachiella carrageenanivorans]|uniref:Helix-turn-helix domain-containing protein n=1 Tax=Reichenbachiella carrageenanivorans TaxID=2979869 RepID=A0ABY6D6Z0_9BACT|nr:hypothetical protein [Reichenbachiella carrageenanivorans]UXX80898.1 hypothetical protein N7E81_07270 [Reichenbachiella carrageenanivorans]